MKNKRQRRLCFALFSLNGFFFFSVRPPEAGRGHPGPFALRVLDRVTKGGKKRLENYWEKKTHEAAGRILSGETFFYVKALHVRAYEELLIAPGY